MNASSIGHWTLDSEEVGMSLQLLRLWANIMRMIKTRWRQALTIEFLGVLLGQLNTSLKANAFKGGTEVTLSRDSHV